MKITMMEAALKYAELNIPVMPLHWICEDGSCSCKAGRNCDSKGKHPLYSGWYKYSTTDTLQIKKWWTETPLANIGVPTGEKSGWLVLDVDEGGDETLSELEAIHGKLPDTVTAVTGSGGHHYIYKYPKGRSIPNKTKFASGLDVRSSGGLIVVSPSLHISGNRYKWMEGHNPANMKPAEAPEWLLEAMCKGNKTDSYKCNHNSQPDNLIPEGSRNSTLASYAGTMRRRGMSEAGIVAALMAENEARLSPPLNDAEVRKIAESICRYQPEVSEFRDELPQFYNARELIDLELPEPVWIVDELIAQGLTILAGKPKVGKSWLALGLALSVASNGKFLGKRSVASTGNVVYLSLEDNWRRLKKRLNLMLLNGNAPEKLHFFIEWQKGEDGITRLDGWLQEHSDTKLVIIDTLAKVREKQKANSNLYADDYEAVCGLKSLADKYNVAVVVVHHLRKMTSDDVLDEISGTTGITGAADTIMILKKERSRADAVLYATGRDAEEKEIALQFNNLTMSWMELGNAEEYRKSKERQDIIDLLKQADGAMSPKEIAGLLKKTEASTRFLLSDMAKRGDIGMISRGKYTFTTHNTNNTNITHNANNTNEDDFPADEVATVTKDTTVKNNIFTTNNTHNANITNIANNANEFEDFLC